MRLLLCSGRWLAAVGTRGAGRVGERRVKIATERARVRQRVWGWGGERPAREEEDRGNLFTRRIIRVA
jgi:hypothetical protein